MFDKDVLLTLFYRKRTEAIKSKQNRSDRAVFKLWLAIIDELRTKSAEIVLSLTEELKIVYEHMVDIYETRTKK